MGKRDGSTTKESAREGTHVTWAIGRIEKGERVEVVYVIQGDPESEYKVSDAQDFHGATFGDEVDEDPNLPEWVAESLSDELSSADNDVSLFPESEDFENQEIETVTNQKVTNQKVTNEKVIELEIIEPNSPIIQEEDNSQIDNENIAENNKNYCP